MREMRSGLVLKVVERVAGVHLGPDDVVPVPDCTETASLPTRCLFPIASILALPIFIVGTLLPWSAPFWHAPWDKVVLYLVGAAAVWATMLALVVWIAQQYRSASFTGWHARIVRSTGLRGADAVAVHVFTVAGMLCLVLAPPYAPILLAVALAAVGFQAMPYAVWPTTPTNNHRERLPRPTIPQGATPPLGAPTRTFSWDAVLGPGQVTHTFTITVPFDPNRVAEFQERNPFATDNPDITDTAVLSHLMRDLVINGVTHEVLEVAAHLKVISEELGLNRYDEACNVLAFVHQCAYAADAHGEYWRYPLETLNDGEGDCDCCTILALALYYVLGFACLALVNMTERHMAAAVSGVDGFPPSLRLYRRRYSGGGHPYFFCETTGDRWTVGEVPAGVDPVCYREIPFDTPG